MPATVDASCRRCPAWAENQCRLAAVRVPLPDAVLQLVTVGEQTGGLAQACKGRAIW